VSTSCIFTMRVPPLWRRRSQGLIRAYHRAARVGRKPSVGIEGAPALPALTPMVSPKKICGGEYDNRGLCANCSIVIFLERRLTPKAPKCSAGGQSEWKKSTKLEQAISVQEKKVSSGSPTKRTSERCSRSAPCSEVLLPGYES
jgi:hypothetical protein